MRRFVLLIVLGMVLQAGMASAVIDFNPLEKSYRPGEYVNLGGIYTNNYTESKNLEIEQVLLHKDLDPMPGMSKESLGPGRIAIIKGIGFTVQGTTDSGVYTYKVTMYEKGVSIESAQMSFEIIGSHERFEDIRLRVCNSPECRTLKSVFVIEGTAYIRVFDLEGAMLRGYVEDDFGFRKDLRFGAGMAAFKLDKTGQFMVRVLAEKEGYENYEMETNFFVIEGDYVLTEFFPIINWVYQIIFAIIVVTALITVVFSLLRGKENRDRFREWLRWRRWRKKERLGVSLGDGKDLKGARG